MVAQLKPALLILLAFGIVGCQGENGSVSSDKSMNTPSAAKGPKMDDWAKAHPDNGAGGHKGEK